MPTPIRQFKDSSNTLHDLDNRYITLSAESGTLTSDQLAVLKESNGNYIVYSSFHYRKTGESSTQMYYAFLQDFNSSTPKRFKHYYFDVNKSTGAYVRVVEDIATENWVTSQGYTTTDTKNTAGSTDTSSKIFLVGATSQAANPQTYSDNQVYATNGQLDANKVRIAEAVTLVYDSTNKCINFNFS